MIEKVQDKMPKATFNQIVRSPAIYYMLVAISVMWIFVYQFIGSAQKVGDNCEEENKHLREDRDNERKKNDDLTTALLVKNGIINEIKKATDSAAKKNFADEAVKIIKK